MTDRPENTRVNIYGREYSIRGEGDPAYIAEIAHFLDMRMRQMTENVAMSSTAKVAILASLNIIDELFTRTRQLEELEDGHQALLLSLSERIDVVLSGTGSSPAESKGQASKPAATGGGSLSSIFQSSGSGSDEKD